MLTLTSSRPTRGTLREQRGARAERSLRRRRRREYAALIESANNPRIRLWHALRWLTAICKGDAERTQKALKTITNLIDEFEPEEEAR